MWRRGAVAWASFAARETVPVTMETARPAPSRVRRASATRSGGESIPTWEARMERAA
jgi:hypothetical protein